MLRLYIRNLPPDSTYAFIKNFNAEVTEGVIQEAYFQSVDCPIGQKLESIGKLIEIYEYDTVWFKEMVAPSVETGTYLEKSFCLPNDVGRNESIISFGFSAAYYRDVMYPSTFIIGLTKIGGLLAVFQISLLLTYFH